MSKFPSWWKHLNAFEKASRITRSGTFKIPGWFEAARQNAPPPKRVIREKPPTIRFPESRLENKLLQKMPILKLERAELSDRFCVPIRFRFARRQLELMEQKNINETDAYQQCEEEFKQEIEEFTNELKESGGNIVEEARHNMMGSLKKREQVINEKRIKHHYQLYRKLRPMEQAEEILSRLNRQEGERPIAIRQMKSRKRTLADFDIDEIAWRDKALYMDVLKTLDNDAHNLNKITSIADEDLKFDSLPTFNKRQAHQMSKKYLKK